MEHIFSILNSISIRWQDIVDILIVSYVIYRIIILLQGTLASRMILSIIFLFFLMKISESSFFKLHTLNWLLTHFWSIAFIALIILFQPELRRALARFGYYNLFSQGKQKDLYVIEEITKATSTFSTKKIGALIVLERETGLEPIKDLGIKIDAIVSSELLRVIFFPNSPLHDGAVIIKDDRIDSAGCFLPLTQNPDLPIYLGTRHRAAIGITEETDAVVVVVSEERGTISICMDGKIYELNDPMELKNALLEIYKLKK